MAEYIDRAVCLSVLRAKANMAVLMNAAPYFEKAAQMLEKLPAADVEPVRHGRWTAVEEHIYLTDGVCKEWTNFYCSICDTPNNSPTNYCPNCGVKMDEEVAE